MNSIKTPKDNIILVPTDFSVASNFAIDHSVEIAKLFDNEITLLYVIEESFFKSVFGGGMEKSLMTETITTKLDEKAAKIKEKHPEMVVNTMIREGKVFRQILEVSKELACDSIVMGFSGVNGMEKFMGSTTTRVVKSSEVPVVIIKDVRSSVKYEKIVLPIDLTKESRQKVDWAIHLAHRYGSEIHVIMEVESDEFFMRKVKANLLQVENILAKNNVKFVSKLLDDEKYPENFGKDIIQYSEEIEADLIMIMTQKEAGVGSYLGLGSFARHIIHDSKKTPIMAINPKDVAKNYWATESFS